MKSTLHTEMLSKSRGHVLRIATILHMLFSIDSENPLSSEVSEMAVKAAVNLSGQHANKQPFVAGKGLIEDKVHTYNIDMLH